MTSLNQSPISTLKVDFHCSKHCPRNVKKQLQQFNGVESISIDPKQGLVTVSGKVNPMVLVKLVRKMGQRAELLSFQKAPMKPKTYSRHHTNQNTTNVHSHYCCDNHSSWSTSDSDSDDDDNHNHHSYKRTNTTMYCQHPHLNSQKNMNKKTNSRKDWSGFGNYFQNPRVWIKSPRRPPNFPQPPPVTTYDSVMHWMKYARTPVVPHGYYNRMPSCGQSNSVSRYYNPMIHYGSYADTYRYPF